MPQNQCHLAASSENRMSSTPNDPVNPFAVSPNISSAPPVLVHQPGISDSTFRYGKYMAVRRTNALMKPQCIKTSQATETKLKRVLYWHHPAIFLLVLVSPLIYIIVSLIMRKRAEIYVPLTEDVLARRRLNLLIAWCTSLLGLGMFIAFFVVVANTTTRDPAPWVFSLLLGPFVLLFGLIYGSLTTRMVYAKRMDDHFVWLKGASQEYLDSLPEWPFGKVW